MQAVGIDPGRGYTQAVGPKGERVLFPSIVGAPSEAYYGALLGELERNGRYKVRHDWVDGSKPCSAQLDRVVGVEADTAGLSSWATWHRQRPDEDLFAFVAAALYKIGVEGDIALAIGSPVAYYPTEHEMLANKLSGSWDINGRRINVRHVAVIPEPAAAVYHLGLTIEGAVRDMEYFRQKVAVLDIGTHSTDGVLVEKGQYRTAACFTEQYAVRQILECLSRYLSDHYNVSIPPHRLTQELRQGWVSINTYRVDLSEVIQQAVADNVAPILRAVTKAWANEPLERAVMVGGGAYCYGNAIRGALPHFRIPDEPEWSIALGLRAYAQFAFGTMR